MPGSFPLPSTTPSTSAAPAVTSRKARGKVAENSDFSDSDLRMPHCTWAAAGVSRWIRDQALAFSHSGLWAACCLLLDPDLAEPFALEHWLWACLPFGWRVLPGC